MAAPPPTPLDAKILVVDDEEGVRAFLQTLLLKRGYEVVLRDSAMEIAAAVEAERPDLVLLDVMMPGKDGFAALKELRMQHPEEALPIIMLTALGSR